MGREREIKRERESDIQREHKIQYFFILHRPVLMLPLYTVSVYNNLSHDNYILQLFFTTWINSNVFLLPTTSR
jgi:hypothetical protein